MYFDNKINSFDNVIKTTWQMINYETDRDFKHKIPTTISPDTFNKYFTTIASSILHT